MMKKNGFTLAEVLITLAIIGVVATLTLPALLTNVAEQQYKTALKKGLNTLSEAGQMNLAENGFSFSSLTSASTNDDEYDANGNAIQSARAILAKRTHIAEYTNGPELLTAGIAHGTGNDVIFFRDGTALTFSQNGSFGTNATRRNVTGVRAIFDANGKKGPNLLSNCNSHEGSRANANNTHSGEAEDCNNRGNRRIYDQFPIILQDGFALPNNGAAEWAFQN